MQRTSPVSEVGDSGTKVGDADGEDDGEDDGEADGETDGGGGEGAADGGGGEGGGEQNTSGWPVAPQVVPVYLQTRYPGLGKSRTSLLSTLLSHSAWFVFE
jgi:hypothetical protein